MHQIRVFVNGEQKTITVDDFVPANNDMPLSNMSSTVGELWISILEKAFAKLF
jgi:Calpain family cysteine protease